MKKLTDNQTKLLQYIIGAHKGGESAKVHTVSGRCWGYNSFHHVTLKSLVSKGLVRFLRFDDYGDPKGWTDGESRFHWSTFEVELTSEGWDFIYRLKR